jgi:hypothetical protein
MGTGTGATGRSPALVLQGSQKPGEKAVPSKAACGTHSPRLTWGTASPGSVLQLFAEKDRYLMEVVGEGEGTNRDKNYLIGNQKSKNTPLKSVLIALEREQMLHL